MGVHILAGSGIVVVMGVVIVVAMVGVMGLVEEDIPVAMVVEEGDIRVETVEMVEGTVEGTVAAVVMEEEAAVAVVEAIEVTSGAEIGCAGVALKPVSGVTH